MSTILAKDLPLDIRQQAVARSSVRRPTWHVSVVRPLGPDDLLHVGSAGGQVPSDPKAPLARLRQPHHVVAQLLAQGRSHAQVSAITGFAPARLRILEADPCFQELMQHYMEAEESSRADITQQVTNIALTAAQILQERMLENPEELSNKELRELMQTGLDRVGYGPKSSLAVDINDPAKTMSEIRALLEAEAQGRVLPRDAIETHVIADEPSK